MAERDLGLTLAGGGNRAFFQMGVLARWGVRLTPRISCLATVSAGASVAAIHFSGRADATHAYWTARRAHVTRNFDPRAVLRGRKLAPHGEVYRDTMIFSMQDGGLERIRSLPFPFYVLAAELPAHLRPLLAVSLGLTAYNSEKRFRPARIHPTWGRRLGFLPRVFDARECTSPEELADLVLASSATPPFTPLGAYRGLRLLDGGMIDNVPAFVADDHPDTRRNLVVLTRPYPSQALGLHGRRLYFGPSQPTPIERWDYTRPELLEATIEMGRRESARLAEPLDRLLRPDT